MAHAFRQLILASLAFLLLAAGVPALFADGARFDLTGPKLEVRVTRGEVTLPIAEVPNLQPGDKLWVHADFPPSQSARYLLVVAFLRGTTNPPPDNWFTKIETWNKQTREEGTFVTVPAEAEQVMLFLAPETNGDFSTLRSAVKGRPGIFVRASQDLNLAGFEQARIEKYLQEMSTVPPGDAKALVDHSALLARTLALKPNNDCFKQPVDTQYNCLTQTGTQMLLDDGHGQGIASALSSGPSSDFINAASYTQVAGGGLYSAYVGAIVDLVRLTSGLHTAQYQYIPAIGFPDRDQLNLRLNAPPSFHNPKSVIVIGLPAIQSTTPPPLRATDPNHISCLLQPKPVLPLEGAPLVYSTDLAHNLVLHLNTPTPTPDIPLTADAFQGGLVPAPKPKREVLPLDQPDPSIAPSSQPTPEQKVATARAAMQGANLTGTVKGMWGFDPFTGPTVPLQNAPGKDWKIVTNDPLIAGQDNHITLASTGTACILEISTDARLEPVRAAKPEPGVSPANPGILANPGPLERPGALDWKPADRPDEVALTLPLQAPAPDEVHLDIAQFGDAMPDRVVVKALSAPAKLNAFSYHAGDSTAILAGTSLDQVKQVDLKGAVFVPSVAKPATSEEGNIPLRSDPNQLELTLDPKSSSPKFEGGKKLTATVALKDGRSLTLETAVDRGRPVVTLLTRSIDQPQNSPIRLAPDDLPLEDHFTFFLKSAENFPRAQQIEIASPDDALHATLSISAGTLVLENKHTVIATIDPLKLFGPSAFGPLRVRAIAPDGTPGDWIPLVTLVRLPTLTDLRCPAHARQQPCTLTGSDLYRVDSFSTDPGFTTPVPVPEGFIGTSVTLPHPPDTSFYVRLRDDPTETDQVTLPVVMVPAPPVNPAGSSPPVVVPIPAPETPTTVPATHPPAPATPAPSQAAPTPAAPTQPAPKNPPRLPNP